MIIVGLVLILTGSIAGALILWLQDASFWQVVLGYVAGGWAGLLLGFPLAMAGRLLGRLLGAMLLELREHRKAKLSSTVVKSQGNGR